MLSEVRTEHGGEGKLGITFQEAGIKTLVRELEGSARLRRQGYGGYARDYYDLWRVLGTSRDQMELSGFASFLREKCVLRNVAFRDPEDFFQETMLAYIRKTWDQWLGPLVPGLLPYETVIGELRPQVEALVSLVG